MATLNSRGHEVLDQTPVEIPLAKLNRQGPSMFERLQAQIFRMRQEAEDMIKDEADLMQDLNDFSYEEDDPDLPGSSTYEIDDTVPDFVSATEIRDQLSKNSQVSPDQVSPDQGSVA